MHSSKTVVIKAVPGAVHILYVSLIKDMLEIPLPEDIHNVQTYRAATETGLGIHSVPHTTSYIYSIYNFNEYT